jgi:CDP-paratose 2-epimerase
MKWIVTGGAGFIGTNVILKLVELGHQIIVVDSLRRMGSETNARLLAGKGVTVHQTRITDFEALQQIFRAQPDTDVVLHLAAQVAVTTSVKDPRSDFEINALGTFNVCEAVRLCLPEAMLLNASTNKVYGGLEHLEVVEKEDRYAYASMPFGVTSKECLDFHSPYGCSKGAGDQYVRDYSRIYGIDSVNFRQSCVYGPYQYGIEDQGWLAWFAICALLDRPVTIYGDGKQVRDILFVEDLVDCYLKAVEHRSKTRGHCYNVGGGPEHCISLVQGLGILEEVLGKKIERRLADWRPGDQRVFVADVREAWADFGWKPTTSEHDGMARMARWCADNLASIQASIA